jgi:hypothetical protein
MNKKIDKKIYNMIAKWLQGSIEKQDAVFNATPENKALFEKAKKMASF